MDLEKENIILMEKLNQKKQMLDEMKIKRLEITHKIYEIEELYLQELLKIKKDELEELLKKKV